jgi:hypothetical protein
VAGFKSDKYFGNKLILLPNAFIQESDDKIANTARKNLVKKLQKKYNKKDIVVIKRVNGELVIAKGDIKDIKGEYKVNIIGHGHEDESGVRRLGGRNGEQIGIGNFIV